jgi:glycosyltransferase involved in cell wall biosynthesis
VSTPAPPLFVSWIHHQGRSTGLAEALGAEALYVGSGAVLNPRTAPLRYVANTVRTLASLLRRRPSGVIVMAPPLPAVVVCWLWCAVARRPLVIDMHTGVFNDPKWLWARRVTWWFARRSALSIVTNQTLVDQLSSLGVDAVAVDNPPAAMGEGAVAPPTPEPRRYVLVPCSYSSDEPLESVIAAARDLPDVDVLLTGRAPDQLVAQASSVPNVRLTGFVDAAAYDGLVRGATAVLCLTTRDLTMQQGGYEALAAGVPLVTSDFGVLRRYFSGGAVFTTPEPAAIAAALSEAVTGRDRLAEEMRALRDQKRASWPASLTPVRRALGARTTS